MNKQKFLNIIQSHVFTENDDVLSFKKITEQYPYSQITHTLLAKYYNETKSTEAKKHIQIAAIYATDRVVLKKIIESTPATLATPKLVDESTTLTQEKSKNFKSTPLEITDIDQLRVDIFKNLEQLQESKKPYTETVEQPIKEVKKVPVIKAKTKEATKKKEKTTIKKKGKLKKATSPTPAISAKKENTLLSQKEQVDLIEKFIQSPPKLTKAKTKSASEENQEDLSQISAKIEEDFASENLAKILIKQGNKDKAIEIYKKLIWKFPQKKAYFATQIEGLKK